MSDELKDKVKEEGKTEESGEEALEEQISDETENLAQVAAAAQAKADEYLQAAQRIQADFENYKRRNKSAIADAVDDGINEAVKTFLPVIDNMERAVDAAKQFGDESVLKGIELVFRQLMEAFEKLDVSEIETQNGFDPNFHNAVMQEPKKEEEEDNQITMVLQKGYMRKGRVLRFAMVKVAK